jgi:integrase
MRNQPNADHRKMVKTKTPGVYKRGNRYVAVYRLSNGKQRREPAATYAEAKRIKAARQTEIARGEFHDASRVTFHAYFLEWVERYPGRGRRGFRESTRKEYRRLGQQYALSYFGRRRRMTEVGPREIANFIRWLCDESEHGRPLSDSTIRNILNPVRSCFATAMHEGLVRTNPTHGAYLPNRQNSEADPEGDRRPLSRTQLAVVLELVPAAHQTLFRFLASTGLRISEALALTWGDLQLDGSEARVKVRRACVNGAMAAPKTKHSRRSVPLAHELVSELRVHRARSAWSQDQDFVFPSAAGTPLDQNNLRSRVLRPVREEADVPWMTFHTLRHTCASLLFARGANAVQVQNWLGHHSAAFTLANYVHLLPDELGEALALSDEIAGAKRRWHEEDLVATAVAT